ncbi:MAG: M20/M25/M40 family metallo-hydrolase, partial [Planctomycetota bacterium]|nr:M20/M25/M40 family metallo-hydrolase [Planctomycetota bacterium]
ALTEPGGILEHARFNIGILEGGVASNVVNSQMLVRFGFRPRPGDDGPAMAAALRACLPADASVEWTERFLAPPLDTSDEVAAFLGHTGLTEGEDVDFWTEAALFHQAGHPTIVLGPGNIAQAHQADEWVAIDSLVHTAQAYTHTIETGVPEVTHVA